MATQEAKAIRRALALNELERLTGLLAANIDVEVPDVRATHRDPQLAEIQRIETINELLTKALGSAKVDVTPKAEPKPEPKAETKAAERAQPAVNAAVKAATKKPAAKKTGKK